MSRTKKIKQEIFNVALYVRLSREDGDDKAESNSIVNQKQMLENYLFNHQDEFKLYNIYSDDNYSGTNFIRPAFQTMMSDIENGKVNCVVVKDLSRFGRDYIETGRYLERVFPEYNIRFIAINDNIDSFKQAYNMLLPISNIFNQQYATDISNKVKASLKTKQMNGNFIGAFASYGYTKDSSNHNKLIIDEYAAEIVRRIFNMYLSGMGQQKVARILNDEKILCPSEYKKQSGLNYINSNKFNSNNYWTYSTIHRVLSNQMYIGNMVQGKTKRSIKGKAKNKSEDEWIIVENTHDPIINKNDWDKVQILIKKNTRELNFENNIGTLSGFLVCADCGRAMSKNIRGKYTYYICGSYKKYGKSICSSHSINNDKLEEIIVDYINLLITVVSDLKRIADLSKKVNSNSINIKKEIEKNLIQLNKNINLKKSIYEDYKDGILTKEEYLQYKLDYQNNENLYKDKIEILQKKEKEDDNDIFKNEWLIKLINTKKIEKLDRSILADFIEKIEIKLNKGIAITWNTTTEINEFLNNIIAEL